jgi:halocyanin-like protein
MQRRDFLTTAAGAAGGAAAVGAGASPATAQNGPDFGGWFDNVPNFDGVEDMTGEDSVTITVGAEPNNSWSFGPAAVQVDPGTEVVWEWSGNGGAHNVIGENADFESELVQEEGHTFSQTFDSEGIIKYFCRPHRSAGMKGAVVVGAAGGGDGGDGGGGGPPDYQGWFSNVPNFESTEDLRGESSVSVTVGAEPNNNWSFAPPAIHVDPGTEIVWEWSGNGGAHNVVGENREFESELVQEEGHTFSQTFEEEGIVKYFCRPHRSAGMKAAVVVGSDYPSTGGGGNGDGGGDGGGGGPVEVNPEHQGVPFQAHFVGMATLLAVLMSLLFTFYTLKYGESAHTKGGNN